MTVLYPKLLRRKRRRAGPTLHGEPCTMSDLRRYVFERDQGCILTTFYSFRGRHQCRDENSVEHSPFDLWRMQLAHVPERGKGALSKKPADDECHLVTECFFGNVSPGPTVEQREFEREWIARKEPSG